MVTPVWARPVCCGYFEYLCTTYCSFEPGVLLWPFIEYLFSLLLVWARRSPVATYLTFVFHIARLSQAFSCGHLLNICVLHIARLSQAFSCGHLVNICFHFCSFEPGVLLWPFIDYLCITYCSFEPGLLNICVLHIARLSQAFSCGHLVNICFHFCSFEPGVLLWPCIDYLFITYCSFEPGVHFWPFIENLYFLFLYSILLVWARRSLVATYWIFVFHIARLSQAFSCGHL